MAFEQALEALNHLPEGRESIQQAIDLRLELRIALAPLAEYGRILVCLREAERLAEVQGDQRAMALVAGHLTHIFCAAGEHDRALEYGQRALTSVKALGDVALEIPSNSRVGEVYYLLGDYPGAIAILRRNLSALMAHRASERFGLPFPAPVHSRTYLIGSLVERGEFGEAIACGEEGFQIAKAIDQPLGLAVACLGVGVPYLSRGTLDEATHWLEHGLELCRAWNVVYWFPRLASALGHAYALAGRIAEAVPLLTEAVARTAAKEFTGGHSRHLARLSEACLLAGQPEEALGLAQQAFHLAGNQKERGHEAWALRLLGEIISHRDPPDVETAEGHYRQAMALAEELGMRPLVAHCHLGLGKLYRATARRPGAQQHLTTATAMYREMDMSFWLEQAETEMAKVGG